MEPEVENDWFKEMKVKELGGLGLGYNVNVHNRKLYTFDQAGQTYLKFDFIDDYILSLDELAYVDTNSCIFRISHNEYIVILKAKEVGNDIAVIGKLGNRYVEKNKLNDYNVEIRKIGDYNLIPLNKIYDRDNLDVEDFIECAARRIRKMFGQYLSDVRKL